MGFSVLQAWLEEIPIRMQSTLLLGLRGPDDGRYPEIKKITRWMRGLVFRPGNPNNVAQFMRAEMPDRIAEKSALHRELEFAPVHFWTHLRGALQVLGHRHPTIVVRLYAKNLYLDMCDMLHLAPETEQAFELRLRTLEWPGGGHPETGAEAIALIQEYKLMSELDTDFVNRDEN